MAQYMGSRKWLVCENCHRRLFQVSFSFKGNGMLVKTHCYKCDKEEDFIVGIVKKQK